MTRGKSIAVGLVFTLASFALQPVSAVAQSFGINTSLSASECDFAVPYRQPFGFQGYRPAFGGGFHASTLAEGYLRGVAAVTTARGQAAYYQSEALKNQEIARNMYLQNRRYELQQIMELRGMRDAAREREKAKILARNLERKQKKAVAERAEIAEWPFPLDDHAFAAHRKQIQGLLKLRAELPAGKRTPTNEAIQLALRDLYQELKADPVTDFWTDDQKQDVKSFLNRTYASTKTTTAVDQIANADDRRIAKLD